MTTPTTTTDPANAAALTAAYLTATAALRSRILGLVTAAFTAQGDYREAAATAFTAQVLPLVTAAQHTMTSLTAAYLTHVISALGGGTTEPPTIPLDDVTGTTLRGVDPETVYRRPYVQVWTDLANGRTFNEAVAAGQRRAQSITATDLQRTKTQTAHQILAEDHRVVGYRRVLVGTHSCGLCVVASSVRYHKSDLMPIHPGCDCGICPIIGTRDPGKTVNSAVLVRGGHAVATGSQGPNLYRDDDVIDIGDLLGPAHQAVRETFGRNATDAHRIDYRKVILVRDHTEIGPVLTVARHLFTKQQVKTGDMSAKKDTYHRYKGRPVGNTGNDVHGADPPV